MAIAQEIKKVEYILHLTEEEAIYLKALLQNPLVHLNTDNTIEHHECTVQRQVIWNALTEAGVS